MPPNDPLDRQPDDEVYRLARGAISLVPGLGGVLAEMFSGIIAEPAQKRRDEVLRNVLQRIHNLEANHLLDVKQLANRPEIHACLLRGIQAALREIETQKVKIIEDAMINTALASDLEPAITAMMFNALERVTTEHIKLLRKVASIASNAGSKRVWPDYVINQDLTEYDRADQCVKPMNVLPIEGNPVRYFDEREIELRRAILDDLVREGLLKAGVERLPETALSPAQESPFVEVTVLGESFLKFVEDPEKLLKDLQGRAPSSDDNCGNLSADQSSPTPA